MHWREAPDASGYLYLRDLWLWDLPGLILHQLDILPLWVLISGSSSLENLCVYLHGHWTVWLSYPFNSVVIFFSKESPFCQDSTCMVVLNCICVQISDPASARASCDLSFRVKECLIMQLTNATLNVVWFFRKSLHVHLCPFLNVHLHGAVRTMQRAFCLFKSEGPSLPSFRRLD